MSTDLPTPTAVDLHSLRRALDGRWAGAREKVRELLRDPRLAPQLGLTLDEQRQRTLEGLLAVAGTDGPKLMFPKEYGGLDEIGAGVTSFETQAHADLSLLVKCGVQFGLVGGAIRHLGTAQHHERYLRAVMDAELLGCFAMTETGHGSDVQSLRTTATYDPATEEFVVCTPDDEAAKNYIGNAACHGRIAVVFAQLETAGETHGVHAVVVPIRDTEGHPAPGVRIADDGLKAGLNGVDNGQLWFDGVRVPRDALLDRFGSVAADGSYSSPIDDVNRRFFTMLGALVQGRISISGSALSATKNAMTIAVRYGDRRRQFKAPDSTDEIVVLDYLAHQRALLPALATTYALSFAQAELVAELHDVQSEASDERTRRRLETFAAGLKATSTWHATATIQACREACGGAGYLAENQLVMLKADTDVFTTFEGDNTVLLQLVAKTLLTNYQAEFGELDTLGTVRVVAEQVRDIVIERTGARGLVQRLIDALPGGSDDEISLLDREYQISLLAWREKHVLEGVARRLRKGFENDEDLFETFNSAQDHLLLAARAHIDARVLEAFDTAIDSVEDEAVAALLNRVCDLHALSVIERERGWFLEHNRLNASRSKAVTSAVNDLCGELRPYADLLVDAFGIPDELITAPIAQR